MTPTTHKADLRKLFAAYQGLSIELYLQILGFEPHDIDDHRIAYQPIEKIDPGWLHIVDEGFGSLVSQQTGKSWFVVDLACAYFNVDKREVLTHPEKYKLHDLVYLSFELPSPRP